MSRATRFLVALLVTTLALRPGQAQNLGAPQDLDQAAEALEVLLYGALARVSRAESEVPCLVAVSQFCDRTRGVRYPARAVGVVLLMVGASGAAGYHAALGAEQAFFQSRRDSAGVSVNVVTGARSVPLQFRLESQPMVEVGGHRSEPAHFFDNSVSAAFWFAEARELAVVVRATSQIRFFGDSGQFLRSLGRHGQGPAEFNGIDAVVRTGMDGLLACDASRRGAVLSRIGFVSSYSQLPLAHCAGVTPDGAPVLLRGGSIYDSVFTVMAYSALAGGGEGLTEIAQLRVSALPRPGAAGSSARGAGVVAATRPFVPRPPSVLTTANHIVLAEAATGVVRYFDFAGRLVRTLQLDTAEPVRGIDKEQFIEDRLGGAVGDVRRSREVRLRRTSFPASFPAFANAVADLKGQLWLHEYPRPGVSSRSVWIVAPEGAVTGRLVIPADLTLLEVGEGYLVAWRLDNGIPSVVVHRLIAMR